MQHPELMEKSRLQEDTGKAWGGERLRWSHTSKSKLLRMTLLAFCCVWVSSQHLQQQWALGWPEATSHTPQRDPDGLALPDVAPIPSRRGSHPFPTSRSCQGFWGSSASCKGLSAVCRLPVPARRWKEGCLCNPRETPSAAGLPGNTRSAAGAGGALAATSAQNLCP